MVKPQRNDEDDCMYFKPLYYLYDEYDNVVDETRAENEDEARDRFLDTWDLSLGFYVELACLY